MSGSSFRSLDSEALRPQLRGLRIVEEPSRWTALGFTVADGSVQLGGVRILLESPDRRGGERGGIRGWSLSGMRVAEEIDGLLTEVVTEPGDPAQTARHANGALGIDHVVVITPDFDRTAARLAQAGLELRRIREAPAGARQGFRRLGPTILELVEAPDTGDGPAYFWGLVVIVRDLQELARALGDRLSPVKPAVQPGRLIATLCQAGGMSFAMAFMSPE